MGAGGQSDIVAELMRSAEQGMDGLNSGEARPQPRSSRRRRKKAGGLTVLSGAGGGAPTMAADAGARDLGNGKIY